MPKAQKVKVTEKIVHPKSRKASQMIKNAHRRDKADKKKSERSAILQVLAEKIQWFKDSIDVEKEKHVFSIQDVHNMIDVYFTRFDEELDLLKIGNNIKGRQLTKGTQFSRENTIRTVIDKEKQIYISTGLEIPDLTSTFNVKVIRAWDGNFNYLPKIKLKRFCSPKNEEEQQKVEETAVKIEMETTTIPEKE